MSSCHVNGQPVPLAHVRPRAMGFGRPIPSGTALAYELKVPLRDALELLAKRYEDLRDDDDPVDYDDDTLAGLRAAGWPALEALAAQHPGEFSDFFLWTLAESLHALFERLPAADVRALRYSLNTVERALPYGPWLRITGTAFEFARDPLASESTANLNP